MDRSRDASAESIGQGEGQRLLHRKIVRPPGRISETKSALVGPDPLQESEGEGEIMPTGKLKMWNADRGFGFIGDDSGGPDIFLHVSALQSAGIDPDNIGKGERLTFDVESTREGKTKASNVRRTG